MQAYGDRKYPKLVEQVASDVLQIRINGTLLPSLSIYALTIYTYMSITVESS